MQVMWIVFVLLSVVCGGRFDVPKASAINPCLPGNYWPPRCTFNGSTAFCSAGLHGSLATGRPLPIHTLVLCHWPEDILDPQELPIMPQLRRLHVINSNITELANDFPPNEHIEELVLAGLRLTWLSESAFSGLRRLRVLDLRQNYLANLHGDTLRASPGLEQVYLGGNPWRCTLALLWLTEPWAQRIVADQDDMICGAVLYPRKRVPLVIGLLKRVAAECPSENCTCELARLVKETPIISVNCSYRGLDAIPTRLPGNTTTLLLRGNRIKSLRPLVDQHRDVLDVYLDNNLVESIAELESSHWLANFRVLSLKNNQLQQLPTYALDNALERNKNAVRVSLGHNPWRCDCLFMPAFQELLAKYESLIADGNDIRCALVDGDDNSLKKISSLSRSAVCREEKEPAVSALDLINGVLGATLFLVLAKLAYDYWQYKRYGKLPWIATKLP